MLMCISEINTTIYTATTLTAEARSYSRHQKQFSTFYLYYTCAKQKICDEIDKIDKNSCAKQRININRMNVNK